MKTAEWVQALKAGDMMITVQISSRGHPWDTVFAVAEAVVPQAWMLTGGLMVQLHAMIGGLEVRPTTDVDLLVDLMSDHRGIESVQRVLSGRGFVAQPGTLTGYTTRMIGRDGGQVDLLVADHLPGLLVKMAVLAGKPVLSMPAGAQARERSMYVEIADGTMRATIRIPDLLGALMLKSAAYSVDHAGFGERHLYDAAMLVSLMGDPDAERSRLHSKTDRKRMRTLFRLLREDSPYWDRLDREHKQSGLDAIQVLASW